MIMYFVHYRTYGILGSTNQNWCCVKLLPMSMSTYPVDCVHLYRLLRAQHHHLCSNGKEGPPPACPPTLTMPHCTYHLIHNTCDITRVVKSYLKNQQYILCRRVCYETLAIRLLYLYSKSGVAII